MIIELSEFKELMKNNRSLSDMVQYYVYTHLLKGKSGFAIFDGGAHKGLHTARMLNLPGCSKVYAIEADPFMVNGLQEIFAEELQKPDSRLAIVAKALQKDDSRKSISWMSSTSHVGRSSIVSDSSEHSTIWEHDNSIEYRDKLSVPATTIDNILVNEKLPVPFMKLDLEGADVIALMGASRTLELKRPVVTFENAAQAPEVHGFTEYEAHDYFKSLDYTPMSFVGQPLGRHGWFGFYEAWAVPDEVVQEFNQILSRALEEYCTKK